MSINPGGLTHFLISHADCIHSNTKFIKVLVSSVVTWKHIKSFWSLACVGFCSIHPSLYMGLLCSKVLLLWNKHKSPCVSQNLNLQNFFFKTTSLVHVRELWMTFRIYRISCHHSRIALFRYLWLCHQIYSWHVTKNTCWPQHFLPKYHVKELKYMSSVWSCTRKA